MKKINRRESLKGLATGSMAIAIPFIIPKSAFGANDRIRVAIIGHNGRGKDHIRNYAGIEGVEIATLCDVDEAVNAKGAIDFEKNYAKKVQLSTDLRKVYDDKNIDVVSIAAPNHWHALAAIWAMQAGKDVYVEKPCSHSFFEGKLLMQAEKKYNRIISHGVQLRSSEAIKEAIQHIRDGLLGRVYMAKGIAYKWRPDIGNKGVSPVPQGLNWDLWQGPAENKPFSTNYVHYNWHWFWNYGNGDIANQGVHEMDLALWGLDVGFPEEIYATGGKYLWNDCKETPELLSATFNYPKQNKLIEFEVRPWMTNREDGIEVGNIFYGDKGYMIINWYDDYKTFLGQKREPGPARKAGGNHYKNFIDAVRVRDKRLLNGPIETGHISSGTAHLANISYRLGRKLKFDPVNEKILNDKEANKMLSRSYRAPYTINESLI